KINLSWAQTGASDVFVSYRLNNGVSNTLTNSSNTTAVINGVGKLNDSDVEKGSGVSGIQEYAVFIELYAQGIMESRTTFKIWNFPGMSVSKANPAVEVKTQVELAAMKDGLNKQYVLADDINITGAWAPIGSNTAPFRGKLYGAGHTITINSGFSG
ncbi:hypothetical protein, partial [Treponema sp. R8-4-B8]